MNSAHTSSPKLRWGILGTGRIVRRNWPAMLESSAATLVALASRDANRAKQFIREMQEVAPWPAEPAAMGSYEDLLARDDIDAVYIPLPTGIRKEWVIRAAEARKHVLCEKPCAVNSDDLREMLRTCRQNQVMFMDGVMFMHDPRFERLKEVLNDGTSVGKLRRITSAFSFPSDPSFAENDIRTKVEMEPAGCIGDLGWYCIRAALWAMNGEMPVRVSCRHLNAGETPVESTPFMSASAEFDFADGTTLSFYCSFRAADQSWLHFSGTAGEIRLNDFVVPSAENPDAFEIGFRRIPKSEFPGLGNAARMFECFAHDVIAGFSDSNWAMIAIKTQILLDACVASARQGCTLRIPGGTGH